MRVVRLVPTVRKDHKVWQVHGVLTARLDCKGFRECKDRRDPKVSREHPDHRGPKGHRVQREPPVLAVRPASPMRASSLAL